MLQGGHETIPCEAGSSPKPAYPRRSGCRPVRRVPRYRWRAIASPRAGRRSRRSSGWPADRRHEREHRNAGRLDRSMPASTSVSCTGTSTTASGRMAMARSISAICWAMSSGISGRSARSTRQAAATLSAPRRAAGIGGVGPVLREDGQPQRHRRCSCGIARSMVQPDSAHCRSLLPMLALMTISQCILAAGRNMRGSSATSPATGSTQSHAADAAVVRMCRLTCLLLTPPGVHPATRAGYPSRKSGSSCRMRPAASLISWRGPWRRGWAAARPDHRHREPRRCRRPCRGGRAARRRPTATRWCWRPSRTTRRTRCMPTSLTIPRRT